MPTILWPAAVRTSFHAQAPRGSGYEKITRENRFHRSCCHSRPNSRKVGIFVWLLCLYRVIYEVHNFKQMCSLTYSRLAIIIILLGRKRKKKEDFDAVEARRLLAQHDEERKAQCRMAKPKRPGLLPPFHTSRKIQSPGGRLLIVNTGQEGD